MTLIRHYTIGSSPNSAGARTAAQRSETIDDHPPVPRAARPYLLADTNGCAVKDTRIVWAHASNRPWGAVETLHRKGDDAAATQLAVFLRWTEARGRHDDYTCWELT